MYVEKASRLLGFPLQQNILPLIADSCPRTDAECTDRKTPEQVVFWLSGVHLSLQVSEDAN